MSSKVTDVVNESSRSCLLRTATMFSFGENTEGEIQRSKLFALILSSLVEPVKFERDSVEIDTCRLSCTARVVICQKSNTPCENVENIGHMNRERRGDSRPVFFRALINLVREFVFQIRCALLIAFFRSVVYYLALTSSLANLFCLRIGKACRSMTPARPQLLLYHRTCCETCAA